MTSPASVIAGLGGVASRSDLRVAGVSDRALTAAVRTGQIRRPRRGRYTTLPSDDPRVTAVAVGGRLTSASLLRLHGAWVWDSPVIHVSLAANASRLGAVPTGTTLHWDRPSVTARGTPSEVDLRDAVAHAVNDLPFEEAVAVLDWAAQSPLFTRLDLVEVVSLVPDCRQRVFEWMDGGSQSILESIVRVRLRLLGYQVESQVRVAGRFIDLVVNERVALEIDGRRFHIDAFDSDRSKDLLLTIDGRQVLRIGHVHVRDHWPVVVQAVQAALDSNRHRAKSNQARVPAAAVARADGPEWWMRSARRRPRGSAGIQRVEDTLRAL